MTVVRAMMVALGLAGTGASAMAQEAGVFYGFRAEAMDKRL